MNSQMKNHGSLAMETELRIVYRRELWSCGGGGGEREKEINLWALMSVFKFNGLVPTFGL